MLPTMAETRLLVRDRLRSREWWLFICGEARFVQMVEGQFYAGAANTDFEAIIMPRIPGFENNGPMMVALFFAKKVRMAPAQLSALMQEFGFPPEQISPERLEDHDVFPQYRDMHEAEVISFMLNEWLKDRPGEQPLNAHPAGKFGDGDSPDLC